MTTGGRMESSGFCSNLTIFGYLYCVLLSSDAPVLQLNQPIVQWKPSFSIFL